MAFDQQLWDASKAVFQDTGGSDCETLFFLCADCKAQILRASCKNWKTEAPQASVCWLCGCNRGQCLANFSLVDTIDGWWEVVLIGVIHRHIAADRRIPDYGLHGVLCVTICGIPGMRDAVAAATGKYAVVVVRNLFLPILDFGHIQARR